MECTLKILAYLKAFSLDFKAMGAQVFNYFLSNQLKEKFLKYFQGGSFQEGKSKGIRVIFTCFDFCSNKLHKFSQEEGSCTSSHILGSGMTSQNPFSFQNFSR